MRLCIFSDLHAHNWSQFSRTLPCGTNSRLAECMGIIDFVANVARDQQCDAVVFVGDLFESRTKLDVDVLFNTYEAMRRLAEGVKVYIVRGNHDCFDDGGMVDSLEGLRGVDNIEVHDTYFSLIWTSDEKTVLYFMPWMSEPKHTFSDWKTQAHFHPNFKHILFMHQSVSEGLLSNGFKTSASLDLADLPMDKLTRVFAGDYHKPQELADGKFIYCGSPLQLNFGEAGQQKHVIVYDTITDEVKYIDTNAPQFVEFQTVEDAEKWLDVIAIEGNRDYVRVYYRREDEPKLDFLSQRIKHLDLQLIPDEQLEERCDHSVVSNDELLVEEYLDQRAETLERAQRERLMCEGLALLTGVV